MLLSEMSQVYTKTFFLQNIGMVFLYPFNFAAGWPIEVTKSAKQKLYLKMAISNAIEWVK